jgi:hypothetical protein
MLPVWTRAFVRPSRPRGNGLSMQQQDLGRGHRRQPADAQPDRGGRNRSFHADCPRLGARAALPGGRSLQPSHSDGQVIEAEFVGEAEILAQGRAQEARVAGLGRRSLGRSPARNRRSLGARHAGRRHCDACRVKGQDQGPKFVLCATWNRFSATSWSLVAILPSACSGATWKNASMVPACTGSRRPAGPHWKSWRKARAYRRHAPIGAGQCRRQRHGRARAVRRGVHGAGHLASWEQGFVSRPEQKYKSVADMDRKGTRIIAREAGAGAQELLESVYRKAGRAWKHDTPWRSRAGIGRWRKWWPWAWATSAWPRDRPRPVSGLHFEPLAEARFDLVFPATPGRAGTGAGAARLPVERALSSGHRRHDRLPDRPHGHGNSRRHIMNRRSSF